MDGVVGVDEDSCVVHDRHVGPPAPGRDAHLPREAEQGKGSAAAVAAGDDECATDTRHWAVDDSGECGLPLAVDDGAVELVCRSEPTQLRRMACNADEDELHRRNVLQGVQDARPDPSDVFDVGGEGIHTGTKLRFVFGCKVKVGDMAVRGQREGTG